jgi:hypothetical protein
LLASSTTRGHTYTSEQVGTRYMFAAVRALVDPTDPGDVKRVHALQDTTTVEQTDSGSQRRLRPSHRDGNESDRCPVKSGDPG